ncbi:tetratricopeptide repeat protein [Myxococcota bacterium]
MAILIPLMVLVAYTAYTKERKPVVAVFDVEAKLLKMDRQLLDGLSEHLATLLTKTGLYRVVPRSEIKKRMLGQKKESYRHCYDQSCQVELGRELAAEKTVSAQVIKLGNKCKVNITIYDLKKATTEAAASVSGECNVDEIVTSLENAVRELVGNKPTTISSSAASASSATIQQSIRRLEKLCGEKDAKSCRQLGESYKTGVGVAKNHPRAFELFKIACNGGEAKGCEKLGFMYLMGQSVSKDIQRANELFRKACDEGAAMSCGAIGLMHESGKGAPRDLAKAITLYRKACDRGAAVFCTNLGFAYQKGKGVTKDIKKAASLYKKACEGDDAMGCGSLGALYVGSDGFPKDLRKSEKYYSRACTLGLKEACVK